MDHLTPEKRSWNMSRIKGTKALRERLHEHEAMTSGNGNNTKPELLVRSLLHQAGYRFTVNGPKNKQLPGRPDIVLPRYKTVIFVHGCFWHRHTIEKQLRNQAPPLQIEMDICKICNNTYGLAS